MALAGSAATAGASESAGEPAETGEEQHKCVFCGQQFPSKPELQTHFRLHANGIIDIKGQPKVRHRVDARPSKTTANTTTKGTTNATTNTTTSTTANTTTANITTATSTTATATTSTTTSTTTTAGGKHTAVCDVCGEVFHTVSLAISHKFRKHPDSVVKHYCPHCGMMFPIKLSRDKHLLTHSSVPTKQLFPCRPCGVTFYNQRAKKFHMDSAHKGATRMVNPVRTPAPSMKIVVNNAGEPLSVYYCHLCGCEYQVKYNLQKHLATKHSQAERDALPKELVQCNLCSAIFYSKRAYEAHSHHHREGDLFATNEQMRQQVVQRIDQDFDHRRVPTPVERYLSASAVTSNRSATWRNIQAARRAQVTSTSSTSSSPSSSSSSSSPSPTSSMQSIPSSSSSTSLQLINSSPSTSTSSISTSSISYSTSHSSSMQFINSSSSSTSTSSSQPHISSNSQSLHSSSSSTQACKKNQKEEEDREGGRKEEQKDKQEKENPNSPTSSAKVDQRNEEEEVEEDKNLNFLTDTNNSQGKAICLPLPALRGGIREEEEAGGRGGGGAQGDFLPWGMDDGSQKRRRMMDESEEEEDGEVMRSLGNVNPDTILSRGVMRGEEEEDEEEEEECGKTTMVEEKEREEGECRQAVVEEEVMKKRRNQKDKDKEEVGKKKRKKRKEEEEGNDLMAESTEVKGKERRKKEDL